MPADLTPRDYNILLHSIGLHRRDSVEYRNHYVTGPATIPEILRLVALGLMEERQRPGFLPSDDRVFAVTDHGKSLARAEHAARFPPLTRKQARYQRFLSFREVCPDLTFGQFLREVPHA